ncbi:retropepsin-like aspartic protease [Tenacibaculum sp. ZS6-P6]|uniref:retropepsin-like aspartic protease n=1 Tax=Tenacibaculum sp. ZS6-P6 TaxID=3447503 RepID=UPI003F95E433
MASLKKVLRKKKYVRIKLKKMKTNHLELKAEINGVKGVFILDTGASNSCVGLHLVDQFKLVSEVSEVKAAGAGATDMETYKSTGNRLRIGDWKLKNCDLVLFDLKHVNAALTMHNAKEVHGIIGADVLEKGKALIDYDKKVLYLRKIKKKKQRNLSLPF